MDFNTLKTNLLDGKFTTYEDFLSDLQLIWDNCKLYNMIGSEIYKLAERMEKMSRREIQKFKSQYGMHTLTIPVSNLNKQIHPNRSTKRAVSGKNPNEKE